MRAAVRRSKQQFQTVVTVGRLAVNLDVKTVEVDGMGVHLTEKEYQMLELLTLRKGTVLTHEMFLNHLYGGMDEPELKILAGFIGNLRKKLAAAADGDNYIETVNGRGYALRDPDGAAAPGEPLGPPGLRGRVSYTIGPGGNPLTLADLPPLNLKSWTIRHKAEIVAATRGGLLSLDEACRRYRLTVEEFLSWQRAIDRHGLAGLRATRIQQYRS
jgi:DNA-binding winged helix-turn-helix (wHTH) protein